jgi:hypothetical protein
MMSFSNTPLLHVISIVVLLLGTAVSSSSDAYVLQQPSIATRSYYCNHNQKKSLAYEPPVAGYRILPTTQATRDLLLLEATLRPNNDDDGDSTGSTDDDGDDTIINNSNDDSTPSSFDMASLQSRLAELSDRENKLPLVVLDAMLPRQVLRLNVQNELLMDLVSDCLRRETPFLGMIGLARLSSGDTVHLARGVEVEIITKRSSSSSSSLIASSTTSDPRDEITISFKAGRRFQVVEGGVQQAFVPGVGRKGWTEGRVVFLDSKQEEEDEAKKGKDPLAVARAITKAKEFKSPNMNTPDNVSLVDRWIELAKKNERQPGQIDALLEQLGDIPPAEEPSECAFWVGALINPLPAMGVALEIRPALLTAKTAEQRVEVAIDGIFKSIRHMEGSERLW